MLLTGQDYLESIRDGRRVYVGGELVDDVTTHPAFRNAARSFAMIYDRKRAALGTGQRSCGWRTSTLDITRPARCGARPRRVTSTSGSSGIPACLCGAPNIPNIGRT